MKMLKLLRIFIGFLVFAQIIFCFSMLISSDITLTFVLSIRKRAIYKNVLFVDRDMRERMSDIDYYIPLLFYL